MRKLLVFQHVASEPLGHLDPLLRASGVRIRYVNFGREPHAQPDLRRYDGLVVLGGPMNVDQVDRLPHLRFEMTAVREAVQLERPVLGICLGAQLLAAAMGGTVHPNPVPEIGWYRLHTRPLAWTRHCRNQAYRLGDRAWGLQFHLEADAALIERWLGQPAGRGEIERHWDARRIARIRSATRRHQADAGALGERVFGEFIGLFARRRYASLPSR
jgi:GMP synthase (glutamine-hydrolysing)